jgi:hypothetical protein
MEKLSPIYGRVKVKKGALIPAPVFYESILRE